MSCQKLKVANIGPRERARGPMRSGERQGLRARTAPLASFLDLQVSAMCDARCVEALARAWMRARAGVRTLGNHARACGCGCALSRPDNVWEDAARVYG